MEYNRRTEDTELKASFGLCPHFHAHENTADHAVKKTFAILGVNIDDPVSVSDFQQDLIFGKKIRRASDHGQMVMVAAIVSGLAYAIWMGVVITVRGK